jgi:hypothetical protein
MHRHARVALAALALASASGCPRGGDREAAIAQATIDRKGYTLRYPSAWKLDTADSDFDLDSYFSIDINEGCHVQFFFFDVAIDPAGAVRDHTARQRAQVFKPGSTMERFTRYGAYAGEGATVRGRIKPIGSGSLRVFAYAAGERSLQILEFCFDEDLAAARPGLALVEQSFRLK